MRTIGQIDHEGLEVRVESYNGDDWEDHVVHIWDTVFRDGKLVQGFHGVDGTVIERPSITLSVTEALGLIAMLAEAVQEA
jgi:hypothetical protein